MTLSTYSYTVSEPIVVDAPPDSRQLKKQVLTRSQTRPQPYLLILGIGILLLVSLIVVHVHQLWSSSIRIFKR